MSKEEFINAFVVSAVEAAQETSSEHPEDIAYVMSSAIQHVAPVLTWMHFEGRNE